MMFQEGLPGRVKNRILSSCPRAIKSRNDATAHFSPDHSGDGCIAGGLKEYMRLETGRFEDVVGQVAKRGFFVREDKRFLA